MCCSNNFRARQDVYVPGNLLLYYEEGNSAAAVAPDVFVVLGASNHRRTSYLLWQESKAPDFVLEVTSRSTREEDQGPKRELYRRLGCGSTGNTTRRETIWSRRCRAASWHGDEYEFEAWTIPRRIRVCGYSRKWRYGKRNIAVTKGGSEATSSRLAPAPRGRLR